MRERASVHDNKPFWCYLNVANWSEWVATVKITNLLAIWIALSASKFIQIRILYKFFEIIISLYLYIRNTTDTPGNFIIDFKVGKDRDYCRCLRRSFGRHCIPLEVIHAKTTSGKSKSFTDYRIISNARKMCDQNTAPRGGKVSLLVFFFGFVGVTACACISSPFLSVCLRLPNKQISGWKTFCGDFIFMNDYKIMVVFVLNICPNSMNESKQFTAIFYRCHHYCSTLHCALAQLDN